VTRIFLLVAALALSSCQKQDLTPSPTNGPLTVFASEAYGRLADTLAGEFQRIYPAVTPHVHAMTTREAVVHFVNDSVQTVLIDRPFNGEELNAMKESGREAASTFVAWDALVVAVNMDNRIDSISLRSIEAIVKGEAERWSRVPESRRTDAVEFVTTSQNTGVHEMISRRFGAEAGGLRVFAVGRSQEECVEYVGRSPRAVTIVSLAAVRNRPATVKILPVVTLVDSVSGRPAAVSPSQVTVDSGHYPLCFRLVVYNAERRPATGSGFAAFVLTTAGQKIVQNSGLVPAVPPSRVIQLTSEQ